MQNFHSFLTAGLNSWTRGHPVCAPTASDQAYCNDMREVIENPEYFCYNILDPK